MAQEKPNPHMQLWDAVQTTDKAFTKTADLDGRQVTSINGTYIAKRATEMFGPVGKGWGFDILEDRFDQGAPITAGSGEHFRVIGHDIMHTIKLKFWYLRGGKKNYITHYGHTPFVRGSKYGPYTDFDAPKKSVTDAIKKCLSLAGFSADIHMGMYDDPNYLYGLELKQKLEEAGESGQADAMKDARADFLDWLDRQIAAIVMSPSPRALDLLEKNLAAQAREKAKVVKYDPSKVEERIRAAVDERKQFLTDNPPTHTRPIQKQGE